MTTVEFRRLVPDDLPLLFTWVGRPHVHRWYSPPPGSYMELVAKYGPRTEPGSAVDAFVIRVDGADAGYIQKYPLDRFPEYARLLGVDDASGIVGMDLFIGDEWRCGRGLGPLVIGRFFRELVLAEPRAHTCVADPQEGNAASIRAFEKAGFHRWKIAANERGERQCIMRRDRDTGSYRIAPIEASDFETCVRMFREMYTASFGTKAGLEEAMGTGNALYLEHLRSKLEQFPEGNVHLWRDDRIVGQLEMRLLDDEPDVAYLSLIHIVPEFRGHGLGKRLHRHAMEASHGRGKRLMRLTVGQRNRNAMDFYRRLGWTVVGTRPHRMPVAVMERPVA